MKKKLVLLFVIATLSVMTALPVLASELVEEEADNVLVEACDILEEDTFDIVEADIVDGSEDNLEVIPESDFIINEDSDVLKSGTCGVNLTYVLTDNGVLTISGEGKLNNTSYVPWSKYGAQVKKIIIEDGVDISSNRGTLFGDSKDLESISFGNTITSIPERAFYNRTSLKEVILGSKVAAINRDAFYGCSGLQNITLGDSVAEIGDNAFFGCTSLKNIVLPKSLQKIGLYAFYNSGLEYVHIPENVTGSLKGTFSNCGNLKKADISDGVTELYRTFYYCNNLETVNIPSKATSIDEAFVECDSLTKVVIPASVTSLEGAFAYCDELYDVKISEGVKSISTQAFIACDSLRSINIPKSVTYIGDYALGYNENFRIYSTFEIKGYKGSEAESYAKTNNIKFLDIENDGIVKFYKSKLTILTGDKTSANLINNTGKKAKYVSSNKKVVTVDSKGKITAKAAGKATITATVGTKKCKLTVTVKKPVVSGSSTVKVGKKTTLSVKYADGKVEWSTSNKKIVTVDKKGIVRGKKKGTATITATYNGKKYTKKITVK